jgi:hypothetical protein
MRGAASFPKSVTTKMMPNASVRCATNRGVSVTLLRPHCIKLELWERFCRACAREAGGRGCD